MPQVDQFGVSQLAADPAVDRQFDRALLWRLRLQGNAQSGLVDALALAEL
jgi:hypothetical protein